MTEAEFQQVVIDIAKLRGWRVAHFRPARTDRGWRTPVQGDAGFPDLVLARNGFVIFAELKSERGKLSQSQKDWADVLRGPHLGHRYHTWRPPDLDRIVEMLR